jgi:hypothetical protein
MRDTKDMAREAGFLAMRGHGLLPHVPEDLFIANVRVTEELNHLVALVRADERALAFVKLEQRVKEAYQDGHTAGAKSERKACEHAATVAISLYDDPVAAIRARGNT